MKRFGWPVVPQEANADTLLITNIMRPLITVARDVGVHGRCGDQDPGTSQDPILVNSP